MLSYVLKKNLLLDCCHQKGVRLKVSTLIAFWKDAIFQFWKIVKTIWILKWFCHFYLGRNVLWKSFCFSYLHYFLLHDLPLHDLPLHYLPLQYLQILLITAPISLSLDIYSAALQQQGDRAYKRAWLWSTVPKNVVILWIIGLLEQLTNVLICKVPNRMTRLKHYDVVKKKIIIIIRYNTK